MMSNATEFASDGVTHEVICVIVGADVLLELHVVCGDEVDDLVMSPKVMLKTF